MTKTNFNKKNIICEAKNLYILLALLLITISLLISVSINFLLIKHKAKKKSIYYYDTSQMTNH